MLDVLNWNKKNADKTKPNLMLMYAWNEFDEGGWLCPTLLCDENGNVQYNADGTAKANTGHLDAVKKAIDIYRTYEAYPSVMVDYEGNITEGNMEHVNLFEEKGDYPEIRIASNGKSIVAGALLESAGKGTYSFYN